jgi:SAM-dependent methyltransferase
VPRLLTFSSAVGAEFVARHGARLHREWPGFRLSDEAPMPGEADVLRTFSTEWTGYDWDGEAYWGLRIEQMFRAMRFMLDLDRRPLRSQRVLEVGIGIGGIADYVASSEECEVVGVDLSYAVEPAQLHFGRRNPFLHVVQASAFRPPFAEDTFDFVYSHGVLHHTFSTRTAVEAVARLPRPGGRLFVWVYSPEDERRNLGRRVLFAAERVLRPLCSRLPAPLQTALLAALVPLYIVHQNVFVGRDRASYGWREALHAARDRFTPRFAHRHTEEEVTGWFRALGYGDFHRASGRSRPSEVPVAFVASTTVDGVRKGAPMMPSWPRHVAG